MKLGYLRNKRMTMKIKNNILTMNGVEIPMQLIGTKRGDELLRLAKAKGEMKALNLAPAKQQAATSKHSDYEDDFNSNPFTVSPALYDSITGGDGNYLAPTHAMFM